MEYDIERFNWVPVKGYPGYVVCGCGLIAKVRKDGTHKLVDSYWDRKTGFLCYTLWKNYQFYKVPLREVIKENRAALSKAVPTYLGDEEEEPRKETPKARKTMDKDKMEEKIRKIVDDYNPEEMSVSAYMKKCREQGYRFTSSMVSTKLAEKKRDWYSRPAESVRLF